MADAAEAVAEGATEAPTVGAPPPEAPAAPAAEAPAAEAPPAAPSWIEGAGGEEAVREAWQFRENLRTEEGVTDAFVEFGVALGLTPAQLAGLFPEEVANIEAAEAEAERPLTKAEVLELLNESVIQPLEQREMEIATANVRNVLVGELDSRQVPEEDREMLLRFADRHLREEDRLDPGKVREAVALGADEFDKWLESKVGARIGAKQEQREGIPTPLHGGGTPGGEAANEPMSMKEAKERVRAQFGGR